MVRTSMLRSTTRALRPSPAARVVSCRRYHNLNDIWAPAPRAAKPISDPYRKGKAKANEGIPVLLAENRCAHIRTWDFLRNPAEALTLIRAVEQKYGPVESFSFQKDFDNPLLYQINVKVTFRDIASFNRVPEASETLHVRAPKVEHKRPGGVGLDEIHSLISDDVEFLTADQVTNIAPERTIDFRVERAKRAYYEESPYRFTGSNHQYRRVVGARMLEWGGFHGMEPIDSTRSITNEELTSGALDHAHMRRALREWAGYLNIRNPFETYPEPEEKMRNAPEDRETDPNALEGVKAEKLERTPSEPAFGEWVPLDIEESKTTRDPFEETIDLGDIKVTSRVTTKPSGGPSTKDSSVDEIDTVPREQTPSLQPEGTTASPIQTAARPTLTTTELSTPTPSAPPPPQSKQYPSIPLPFPKGNSILSGSESTRVQLPSSSSPPFRSSKPKVDQKELQTQLEEARKIAATVRSFEKKVAGRKDERAKRTEQRERTVGMKETQEVQEETNLDDTILEPNPRFSSLFNRLQNVFKG